MKSIYRRGGTARENLAEASMPCLRAVSPYLAGGRDRRETKPFFIAKAPPACPAPTKMIRHKKDLYP